jgi:hypothetical protein
MYKSSDKLYPLRKVEDTSSVFFEIIINLAIINIFGGIYDFNKALKFSTFPVSLYFSSIGSQKKCFTFVVLDKGRIVSIDVQSSGIIFNNLQKFGFC